MRAWYTILLVSSLMGSWERWGVRHPRPFDHSLVIGWELPYVRRDLDRRKDFRQTIWGETDETLSSENRDDAEEFSYLCP